MAEFEFARDVLKRGINLVKTIKPSVGDISFRFSSSGLTLFSFDNRRYIRVEVSPTSVSDVDENFISEEFYIFLDKTAIFDTELDNIVISVSDSSMDVKAFGDGQTRKSSLKKRSTKSKRPSVPLFPDIEFTAFSKSSFDDLLKSVGCSASIKENKTEDDMRVMQVHFYDDGHAMSSTRYHVSIVSMEGMNLNTSLVSADIPVIRSFLSKMGTDKVWFGQDSNKVYFADLNTKTYISLAKVASEKPAFNSIQDEFKTVVSIDQELLMRNLRWASLCVERTQRVTVSIERTNSDLGSLVISFQKQAAEGIPVRFIKGDNFQVDVPVDKFMHIVGYLSGNVNIKYGHSKEHSLFELSGSSDESVKSQHYIASMKTNAI